MPQGLRDLFGSERGVFAILLVLAVTILAVLKIISGADWLSYTKWIAIAIIASKTFTGAVQTVAQSPQSP